MHGFLPLSLPFALAFAPLFIVLIVWSIAIKGYALWVAARAGEKWWFVALLILNTVGILELVYLIWFSPPGSNKLSNMFQSSGTPAEDSSGPQA
jgi:hypothetical protein